MHVHAGKRNSAATKANAGQAKKAEAGSRHRLLASQQERTGSPNVTCSTSNQAMLAGSPVDSGSSSNSRCRNSRGPACSHAAIHQGVQ